MADQVQVLQDYEDIRQIFYRFAEGLDNRDWSMISGLCHNVIDTDYTAWGISPQQMSREQFVGLFQASFWRPDLRTQHLYTNFRIHPQGDAATVTFNFLGQHYVPQFSEGEEFFLRGEYTDTLRRDGDSWKIDGVKLRVFYTTGAATILSPKGGD